MKKKEDNIREGAILIARQMLKSELWLEKPCSWKVIWIYILSKVNYAKFGRWERGEGYFNFTKEFKNIGPDITLNMVKKFLTFAKMRTMISTRRSTRGMIIKVLKYDEYQTLDNYERTDQRTDQRTREEREKNERRTPITNIRKKERNYIGEASDLRSSATPENSDSLREGPPSQMVQNRDTSITTRNDDFVKSKKKDKKILQEVESDYQQINDLINLFRPLNPAISFGQKTYRDSARYLIRHYGIETATLMVKQALSCQGRLYAPVVTNPYQLKTKLGEMKVYFSQEKEKREQKLIKDNPEVFIAGVTAEDLERIVNDN
jgi:hypothetical protein